MNNLSYRAAEDLLTIIRYSQFAGAATWTETMDRLVALRSMCSLKNPSRVAAERILVLEEWPMDDEWEIGEIQQATNGGTRTVLRPGEDSDDSDDEPDFLYLYPGSHTGLADWEFRPYDADPYPSVPHGHWMARKRPKLDPYQGWVYNGTKQIRREAKKKIVALWNDRLFRKFAMDSLRFHLENFPYHRDWRVDNPLRLPRRR